mgnify:CR=1 FL=1
MSEKRYLQLLSEKYPTIQSVCTEIINLNAILNLPKGTEHFMSDLHGEYEAFCHLLNNCAGEVRDKVDRMFSDIMTKEERKEICTLVYYPKEKMNLLRQEDKLTDGWYRDNLKKLINIAKKFSSKYTRSKVRKAMPQDYRYIIDELLHMQEDEDNNQIVYHEKILDTIISIKNAEEFIEALSTLIKRLAVDHLHIVGDVFDRGEHPDDILDLLMEHHSIDIQWGNHDILWMGATAGSDACIATTIRNNIQYNNMQMLENGYGISLRTLTLFAERLYPDMEPMKAALKAISVILFKLEGQIISRHPEYNMDDRRLLHKINYENGTIAWITPKDLSTFTGRYIQCGERNITEIRRYRRTCISMRWASSSVRRSSGTSSTIWGNTRGSRQNRTTRAPHPIMARCERTAENTARA